MRLTSDKNMVRMAMGAGKYPEAGQNAPPGVQQEVERLRKEGDPDRPLLYQILGASTPDYKMSKEQSDYVSVSSNPDQTCANCIFAYQKVVTKKYICSQISGEIDPDGWSRLWKGVGDESSE